MLQLCVLFVLLIHTEGLIWQQANFTLPTPLSHMAVAYDNLSDSAWFLGDYTDMINVLEWNFQHVWIEHAHLPQNVRPYSKSYIQIGSLLYMHASGATNWITSFDIDTKTYNDQAIAKLDPNVLTPCLSNKGGEFIYVVGGGAWSQGYLDSFYIYDIMQNQWIVGPPMLQERGYLTCETHNDFLYVIGGDGPNFLELDSVIKINVTNMSNTSLSWIELQDKLSMPKHSMRSIVINDHIYVIGGYNQERNERDTEVDVIDTNTDSITSDSSLVFGIMCPGVLVTQNIVYVFGGGSNDGTTDRIQYTILYPTSNPTAITTEDPILSPTANPTAVVPSTDPTLKVTINPSILPSTDPTSTVTINPSILPSNDPTLKFTINPSILPINPSNAVTKNTETDPPTKEIQIIYVEKENDQTWIIVILCVVIICACACIFALVCYHARKNTLKNEETYKTTSIEGIYDEDPTDLQQLNQTMNLVQLTPMQKVDQEVNDNITYC